MTAISQDKPRPGIPAYQSKAGQVAARIREHMILGHWPQGLPAERRLAADMGVGRMTLRAALAELRRGGMLQADGREEGRSRNKRGKRP